MKQESSDTFFSYFAGGGTVIFAWLSDLATVAEQIGMIAACALVLTKLWQQWRGK